MSNTQQGHYIITEDDALETYRRIESLRNAKRLERYETKHKTNRSLMTPEDFKAAGITEAPTELPTMEDFKARDLYTLRVPTRLLAFVRAKADMEDLDLSNVIFNALEAYIEAPVGASCTYLTDEEIAALPTPGDINATITTE